MEKPLEGKVAIVTGSGQGVGRGIAVYLARQGAKVVTNNRRPYTDADMEIDPNYSEEERQKLLSLKGDAEGAANQIITEGGEAIPFYGSVADFDTAGEMVQKAVETFGRIDIIVNNAAGLGSGTVINTSEDSWDYQTVPKLKGAFNTMFHALPHMAKQQFGRIINVASDAWIGMPNLAAYSAANAGLVGLTKANARDMFRVGITSNAICPQAASPGHVIEFTSMIKKLEKLGVEIDEEKVKEVEEDHGPAEDLGPFIAYLCTQEAEYVNGAVFSVTASGRITLYSEPAPIATIKKDGSPWTMEELKETVPDQLLKDYTSIVAMGHLK